MRRDGACGMPLDERGRSAFGVRAEAKGGKNAKFERSAGNSLRSQRNFGNHGTNNSRRADKCAGDKAGKSGAASIVPECGTGRESRGTAGHRAMMLTAAPTAGRQARFVIRAPKRAQQGQPEEEQQQDCRKAPQATW